MGRKWANLKLDRSVGSWTRLVMGFVSSLLALSLILAGLNSLLSSPTGLSMPGLGTGIGGGDLGGQDEPGNQGNQGTTGNTDQDAPSSTIGEIATELSNHIQFHGTPDGPALPVMQISGQTGTAFLRVGVPQSYPNTSVRAPMEPYQGSELVHQLKSSSYETKTITIDPVNLSSQLPTPLYTTNLSSDAKGLSYSPEVQTFRASTSQADPYEVTYELHHYSETLLNGASVARRPSYVQLPNGVTQRTKDLAKELTAEAQTPYQQAKLLEQYLKNNYTYDPHFQGPPQGEDPVDWFLFEEKAGVCGSFNSAFVIMARSLGLPARIVTGYRIDPDQSRQVVTSAQGHAYSEVLFDQLGWVTFDATGSDTRTAKPIRLTIDKAPDRLVAGESAQIEGSVTDEGGQPLSQIGVMVSLHSDEDETIVGKGVSKDGRFAIEMTIPQETRPAYYDLVAQALSSPGYASSADNLEIPVYAHTEIKLDPLTTTQALLLPLNGQLLQLGTEHVLPDEYLAAALATKEPVIRNPVTDSDGRFATEIEFEPSAIPGELPTKMKYTVSFPGEGLYLPTEVEGEVTIPVSGDRIIADDPTTKSNEDRKPQPWWVTALALAGLATLLLLAWRFRERLAMLLPKRNGSRAANPATPAPCPALAIELPEIEDDLPTVWGGGEPLAFQIRSTSGELLSGPLTLTTDEASSSIPLQHGSDTSFGTVCFTSLGLHTISVLVDGKISAEKTVKIVSYRDEIIEGGQRLYHASAVEDPHPIDRLTPREFAQAILARGCELPQRLTRAFVDLFEIATYSLEPISRQQYVQFYRACCEINPEARSHQPSDISSVGE